MGTYDESSEYARSYKSVIIYVQNGLADHIELFKVIAKSIFTIQSTGARKYPLLVFGFGSTKDLQHEKKYFDFGYLNDKYNIEKVAQTISRISGHNSNKNSIIPALFPKTDMRSLYSGKTKIENDDLLIIIGKENEVLFNSELKHKINRSIKNHILFVDVDMEEVKWHFGKFEIQFI